MANDLRQAYTTCTCTGIFDTYKQPVVCAYCIQAFFACPNTPIHLAHTDRPDVCMVMCLTFEVNDLIFNLTELMNKTAKVSLTFNIYCKFQVL